MKHPTTVGGKVPSRSSQQAIDDLCELIAALDGRLPRLERAGEIAIAREAAALRQEALERIAALRETGPDRAGTVMEGGASSPGEGTP